MADFVAIGLRALSIAAALQAAGAPIFVRLFGRELERSAPRIHRMGLSMAVGGLVLTLVHAVVEPARLSGELRGIWDGSLQAVLLSSDFGTAIAIRTLGLGMIVGGSLKPGRFGEASALIGASLVAASFAFMGHTAANDQRWLLAPLLITHLLAVAFWFGALWPLLSAARLEEAAVAGAVIRQFSKAAIRLVPVIFLAGVAMAYALLPDLSALRTPYGLSLIAKVAGFSLLMVLAAANKWRFGPKVAGGERFAVKAFRCSVLAEWVLVFVVVAVTAAMTSLFSPEH